VSPKGVPRIVSPESVCDALHLRGMLEDCIVKDVEGRDFRLGELWRERPAVLVFVRHFG